MAMTLAQAGLYTQTQLAQSVAEMFVQESPVLDRLPLMPINGNSYAYNVEDTLPGVAFRGVNEAYVESTGTIVQRSETLSILGGDADVDRFLVQTSSSALGQLRAGQQRMKVKSASYKFQDAFINGDVAVEPRGFDGLKKRLTGNQVIDAGTNGLGPVAGGFDFFDKLDQLFGAVGGGGPDVAYANSRTIQRILSAGRRASNGDLVQQDSLGKRQVTWNGVPIIDIGRTSAGAQIIPQTETMGSSTTSSSIYAVKFGDTDADRATTGITNGGIQVYDMGEIDDKPVYRTRIEFYVGLATFSGTAAARLRGVLDA